MNDFDKICLHIPFPDYKQRFVVTVSTAHKGYVQVVDIELYKNYGNDFSAVAYELYEISEEQRKTLRLLYG